MCWWIRGCDNLWISRLCCFVYSVMTWQVHARQTPNFACEAWQRGWRFDFMRQSVPIAIADKLPLRTSQLMGPSQARNLGIECTQRQKCVTAKKRGALSAQARPVLCILLVCNLETTCINSECNSEGIVVESHAIGQSFKLYDTISHTFRGRLACPCLSVVLEFELPRCSGSMLL